MVNARTLIEKFRGYFTPHRTPVPVWVNPTGSEYREMEREDSHGEAPVRAFIDIDNKQVLAWPSGLAVHQQMANQLDLNQRLNKTVFPVFIDRGRAKLATSYRLQDYRLLVTDLSFTGLNTSRITDGIAEDFKVLELSVLPIDRRASPSDLRVFSPLSGHVVQAGDIRVHVEVTDRIKIHQV